MLVAWLLVCATEVGGSLHLPPQEDWHYPVEEAAEYAALMAAGLRVTKLRADSNSSGTLVACAANGSSAEARRPGDAILGWTLRGFLTGRQGADLAVLEFESTRWGLVAFLGPEGKLSPAGMSGGCCFRKGVGATASLQRPKLAPQLGSSAYYAAAVADPADLIRRAMENSSAYGETTFAAAAAYLAPTHDYALVGNARSHTKFSVAQDGKVWLANFSIFSPTDVPGNVTGGAEPGVLLFDPREYVSRWPSTGNFSEYKTSILGRFTRAVALAAWDKTEKIGFALTAVPNVRRGIATQPYDVAELLLRLDETSAATAAGPPPPPPRYFAVRGCVIVGSAVDRAAVNGTGDDLLCTTPTQCKPAIRCRNPADTATTELHDAGGGLFHANLLDHGSEWVDFFNGGGTGNGSEAAAGTGAQAGAMQVELRYDMSEGARLVDMGRATIASAMSTFLGNRPNYGDGANYWSVDAADRGALPLESFALNHALLLWGQPSAAAERVEYYLLHYVRGADGLTPLNSSGTNTSAGTPGSIDLKHWRDACFFADSYADLGRWMNLWSDTARAQEARTNTDGAAWVRRTWPQVKLMALYTLQLRANATKTRGIAKGLIYGPAEFDECLYQQHWFSISAWAWRGLLQLQRFLVNTAVLQPAEAQFAATLHSECAAFKCDLDAARDAALVRKDGASYFLPPYAVANFTPYAAMPFSNRGSSQQDYGGGAAYANFRYFSEMLSAQFMGAELDVAVSDFRESHFGTLSSMTRFRTHLDDMPAAGYAYSAAATNRTRPFISLLFGHIANYQSRGSFNAPEQLGFNAGGDSFRALLSPGTGEADIDACVPSTLLVAMMLRWMLVFEERDEDTIWVLKMAPRRFFAGADIRTQEGAAGASFLSVQLAATRFGWVSFCVGSEAAEGEGDETSAASPRLQLVVNVTLSLHGRGFVLDGGLLLAIRLRDPDGKRPLRSAKVVGSNADSQVKVRNVDGAGENVALEIARSGPRDHGSGARTQREITFKLVAQLYE